MILIYRDLGIVSSDDISDIDRFIKNRPMFKNMTKTQLSYTDIVYDNYSEMFEQKFAVNILDKKLILSNLEYDIFNIHYSMNEELYKKYSLYQYIYTHPLLRMHDIDEYIKYRDKLDQMCDLDRTYRSITSRTI